MTSQPASLLLVTVVALTAVTAAQRATVDAAWELIAKGQREQAATLLRQVIKAEPANFNARLLLGSVLMEAGDRTESIAQIREAVKLRPASGEAHNALGEAYNSFGDSKSARPEFERAIAIDSSFAQARVNLAALLIQAGDGQAAKGHLDRAIKLFGSKEDAAYPLYLRAKVYSESRDFPKVIADLEQAVALRPDFAEAWSDLGDARKSVSDDAGALTAFRRAVELNPEDAIAQTRLGSKLLDDGKAHEAVEHLQHAVRLDPNNQSALNALQLALRRDGQKSQADTVRQRLSELMRNKDKADQNLVAAIELNNRGAELEKKGDIKEALEKYQAALAVFPEHVGIRTNLAVALLKLGRWQEGITEMRNALQRDPGNDLLKKALDDALAQAPADIKQNGH